MPPTTEGPQHTVRTTAARIPTGSLLLGYVVLLLATAIGTNVEGLMAGGIFGGRSPEVPATIPAGDLVTWAAVLVWCLLLLVTGAVTKVWWAFSPLGIATAAYALRVFIVGFQSGDIAGLLIAPALITIGVLIGYSQGRAMAGAPTQSGTAAAKP